MNDVVAQLNHIVKILQNISDKTSSNSKLNLKSGCELFKKIFELGLTATDPSKKQLLDSEKELNNLIVENLAINSDWIKKFIVNFSYIFLTELYTAKTSCTLRSGIEFLFLFWGESTHGKKKLKDILDPLNRGVPSIDKHLANWLLDPDNWNIEKPDNIPESHWWFQPP